MASPSDVEIACPKCGVRMTVPRSGAEKPNAKARCLKCQTVFAVGASRVRGGAPPAGARRPKSSDHASWEVSRPDYDGQAFDADELASMAQMGSLLEENKVRGLGSPVWVAAGDLEDLRPRFAIRRKEVDARLQKLARMDGHRCNQHTNAAAEWVCVKCASTFCDACAHRDGDQVQCRHCRYGMAPIDV